MFSSIDLTNIRFSVKGELVIPSIHELAKPTNTIRDLLKNIMNTEDIFSQSMKRLLRKDNKKIF